MATGHHTDDSCVDAPMGIDVQLAHRQLYQPLTMR